MYTKCFDIQSIWITILFQRISQVNCTSITFYRKLRKFVVYLLMIIRKRSINYAFVSLLFFSLSHSFSLIGCRSQTHRKSAALFRLDISFVSLEKKLFESNSSRARKIIDNGRRFEAWNFPSSSPRIFIVSPTMRRRKKRDKRRIGSLFFFGYKFSLVPQKKVSCVNDISN